MDSNGTVCNGTVCNGMDSNAMDSNGFVAGVGCVVSGAVTGRDEPLRRWALRTGRRRAGLLGPAESGEVRQKLALAHVRSPRDNSHYRAANGSAGAGVGSRPSSHILLVATSPAHPPSGIHSSWQSAIPRNHTPCHGDNLDLLIGMNNRTVNLTANDPPCNKSRSFHARPDSPFPGTRPSEDGGDLLGRS